MSLRLYSTLPAVLALLAAPLWAANAGAQTTPPDKPAAGAPAAAEPPGYRSAFEGYQAYTDEKTGDWKQANDTTARVGGWRAYAREASQAQPPAGEPMPAASAVPAKP